MQLFVVCPYFLFFCSYEQILTSVYDSSFTVKGNDTLVDEGRWRNVEGAEFIFYDGSTTEPLPKRAVFDGNFHSKSVQVAGLFISSLAVFLAIASAIWIYINRKERAVTASQPEFLYALCFGAALVAASLIFVSFDESDGFSESCLSSMCAAFPWLFDHVLRAVLQVVETQYVAPDAPTQRKHQTGALALLYDG